MVGGSPTGLVGAAVVAVQLPTSGAVPVRIRKSSRTVAVESSGPTLLEWVASPLTCCDGSGASGCGAFLTGGTVGRCWLRSGFGLGVAVLVDRWARRDSWGGVWQRAADTRAHSLLLGSGLPGGWIGLHRRSLAAIPAGVSKVYVLGAKTALIPQRREGEERKKERKAPALTRTQHTLHTCTCQHQPNAQLYLPSTRQTNRPTSTHHSLSLGPAPPSPP